MKTAHGLVVAVLGAAVLAGSLLVSGQAFPEPAKAKQARGKQPSDQEVNAQIVRDLLLAAELTEVGRRDRAPEALLTAAGLLLKVQAQTGGKLKTLVPKKVEDEKGNVIELPAGAARSFEKQAEDLFDEVEGQGLPGTKELIKAIKDRGTNARGMQGGPQQGADVIPAGGLRIYTIPLEPNKPAQIAMQSSQPVSFRIFQPNVGDLYKTTDIRANHNWVPEGKEGAPVSVQVFIKSLGQPTQTLIYVN